LRCYPGICLERGRKTGNKLSGLTIFGFELGTSVIRSTSTGCLSRRLVKWPTQDTRGCLTCWHWQEVVANFTISWSVLPYVRRVRKIAKATISFVLSVRQSVRMEQLGSHWRYFREIWYLRIFGKSVEKIQVSLKSDKNNGTLHEDLCTFMVISR
jgi:hypothetical protein